MWPSFVSTEGADLSTGYRKDRSFELIIPSVEFGMSNLSLSDITGLIDVASGGNSSNGISGNGFLSNGAFAFDLGASINPFYLRIGIKSLLVLDMSVNSEFHLMLNTDKDFSDSMKKVASGGASSAQLSGKLDIGAYAWFDVTLGARKDFLKNKLRLRMAPSLYFPLLYMPQSAVSFSGTGSSVVAEGSPKLWYIDAAASLPVGLDASVEGRYALWPVLDIGAGIKNIPLAPATMKKTLSYKFEANIPAQKLEMTDIEGEETFKVLRPIRFELYEVVKPFKSNFLIVRNTNGVSINTVSDGPAVNWGLEVEVNPLPIFSATAGTKLFENVWNQHLALVLSLGVFETELGFSLRGTTFANSWGGGFGAALAFRFGF